MCGTLHSTFSCITRRISKYFKNVRKVCRVITLLDATLGFIILTILIIRKIRNASEYSEVTIEGLVLMGLQAFEISFALLLYEGVRRDIICMIQVWFLYCLLRLGILVSWALTYIVNPRSKFRLILLSIEGTFTLFHIVQCIFLIAWHKSRTSSTQLQSITINTEVLDHVSQQENIEEKQTNVEKSGESGGNTSCP